MIIRDKLHFLGHVVRFIPEQAPKDPCPKKPSAEGEAGRQPSYRDGAVRAKKGANRTTRLGGCARLRGPAHRGVGLDGPLDDVP